MTSGARAVLLLPLALLWPVGARAAGEGAYRLKPGAKGKVCLTCHTAFEETLNRPSVHTPVKAGDCSDCHDPHAADHGKLLAREPERICLTCHRDVVPAGSKSVHSVVGEGACVRCHDPHASRNKNILLAAGSDLCLGCHKDLAKAVEASKFRHSPVSAGCLTCHDPHGSSVPGILRASTHAPVANKMCGQCHLGPGSAAPLATKRQGLDLCRGCHAALVNEAFSRNRIHWPLVDRRACLNCHSPHAARTSSLLASALADLCGSCHRDTMDRHAKSPTKHPPIEDGECSACHEPHAANQVYLLSGPEKDVCGECHDWTKHSAHPMGEKVRDPRNGNLEVGCASCHRTHGTPFKALSHFDPKMNLCVQCHESLKR